MSQLTYKYYRHSLGHSRFTSFMLASDLKGLRRVLFVGWLILCGWIAWNAPTVSCL